MNEEEKIEFNKKCIELQTKIVEIMDGYRMPVVLLVTTNTAIRTISLSPWPIEFFEEWVKNGREFLEMSSKKNEAEQE